MNGFPNKTAMKGFSNKTVPSKKNPACTKSHTRQRELKRARQDTLNAKYRSTQKLMKHSNAMKQESVDVMSDKNDEQSATCHENVFPATRLQQRIRMPAIHLEPMGDWSAQPVSERRQAADHSC